jgi:two-component system uhpT operon response regulator UhpA
MQVAIVDDDESVHLCLNNILQFSDSFRFAGSFSNAAQALTGLPALSPHLALIDVCLPDLNGIKCAKRLKQTMPRIKIVIVISAHETNWVTTSREAGAVACLVKPFIPEQLVATLTFASIDPAYDGPNVRRKRNGPVRALNGAADFQLNQREEEVLRNLAEGLLYKEISDKMGISYAAVHKCQHRIYKKLEVSNRSEAIKIWFDGGRL